MASLLKYVVEPFLPIQVVVLLRQRTLMRLTPHLDVFPLKEVLPRNVGLYKWDIKIDVPTEPEGPYNVVHVRNIVFVLSDEEIEDVLSKLLKLLSMIIYK